MRPIFVLPVILLAAAVGLGILGLRLGENAPSLLEGQPVPAFELAAMPGYGAPFGPEDLRGEVTLVNVFGSWCAACRIEHPVLLEIGAREDVRLWGIDWADTPERGAAWLTEHGNPFARVGNDETGRAAIALGVTGAPETFLIDATGRIRYRHQGPITPDFWAKSLAPMVADIRAEGQGRSSASADINQDRG